MFSCKSADMRQHQANGPENLPADSMPPHTSTLLLPASRAADWYRSGMHREAPWCWSGSITLGQRCSSNRLYFPLPIRHPPWRELKGCNWLRNVSILSNILQINIQSHSFVANLVVHLAYKLQQMVRQDEKQKLNGTFQSSTNRCPCRILQAMDGRSCEKRGLGMR